MEGTKLKMYGLQPSVILKQLICQNVKRTFGRVVFCKMQVRDEKNNCVLNIFFLYRFIFVEFPAAEAVTVVCH